MPKKNQKTNARSAVPLLQPATLPREGYVRLWHIVGDKKKGMQGLFPVSRSSFLAGVKSGLYPAPVKVGARMTAWRVEDIAALVEKFGGEK